MDRNGVSLNYKEVLYVALRKESVDRNISLCCGCFVRCRVALRKESVDRNLIDEIQLEFNSLSLSARRAWIEIRRAD